MAWGQKIRRGLCAWVLGVATVGAAWAATDAWWQPGHPGRPSELALQAMALLAQAHTHGLEPRDYAAEALQQALGRAAAASPPPSADDRARLSAALDAALQRYLVDLNAGRVDPTRVHQGFRPTRRPAFDAGAALAEALAQGRLELAVQAAVPRVPQYERLREALALYRRLQGHAAWAQPLPPLPRDPSRRGAARLSEGQAYAGLAPLAERLRALGDLPGDASVPPRYEGVLVAAVRAFQARHGLAVDGIVGPATYAQLQVTPGERVRQIALTLERLRWTPLLQGPRMVVVNIPEFTLRAYEVVQGRIEVRHEMKVIVGRAMDTRTPVFDEDMRFIEFSPYWNVPPSIARGELVPRLRRDPAYFDAEGFEFVARDGRVLTTLTRARLDAVLAGELRIRQRPGPKNALGDIKFVFPNRDHIFLHHTPATSLFERERRDFSHGCIRIEQPVALARFVLEGMAGWDEDRIRTAMQAGVSSTLKLAQPVPVLIAYGTVLVRGARVHFFEDVYGHDRLLDQALRAREVAPPMLP